MNTKSKGKVNKKEQTTKNNQKKIKEVKKMLIMKDFEELQFDPRLFEDAKESKCYMVFINLRTNKVWTEPRNFVDTPLMYPAYVLALHQGTGYKHRRGYDHITKEEIYSKYITKETELLELISDAQREVHPSQTKILSLVN